ncbi:HVO_0234 family beta-propeller protein [Salinigranum salinum]|uniref:HVO_0234 family beta-propeller protein n=1 Tax=Salinigranum salinum TaxID=1364937 RepID=UPI0012606D57|nr:hypothetical protein [Salinigranum salinum]
MTDDDLSIDEKRVFSSRSGKTEVFVAAAVGVVVVDVSDDRVGGFHVDHRCTARDVAGRDGRIAVATDEDVLLAPGYEATGFGPATAVGLADDRIVAVGDDGRVGTLPFASALGTDGDADVETDVDADADTGTGTDADAGPWRTVGRVDGARGVDALLVATADGVRRIVGGDLHPAGLSDVRDVAAAGPFAATGEGLFYLGNGWMEIEAGEWDVVDATPDRERAHAAGVPGVRRRQARDGGEWRAVDLPLDGPPVGFAYGDGFVCTVTGDGTFLVDAGDGPRTQALGLRGVGGIAVP